MEIRFHRDDQELTRILDLQRQNSKVHLSKEELLKEGFVTLSHTVEDLKIICGNHRHTIALERDQVIGYALTMISQKHHRIPGLMEMIEQIKPFEANNNYLIMGQICIGKPFRGKGVFPLLYQHIKHKFSHIYNGIYTEIDDKNPRSLRAHEKVGFVIIKQYINKSGHKWHLVYWDWKT